MTQKIHSMASLIRLHAAQRGDAPALTFRGETRSYRDLHEESSKVANALRSEGVEAQLRVAFLDKNSPEYFALLFGAAKLNAVTLAVNWRLAPPEVEYVINNAEARILFLGTEFLGHLDRMNLETVARIVVCGDCDEDQLGDQCERYADWITQHSSDDTNIEPGWDDTCYQLYTSGTTGLPKGVELTNKNFFSMMDIAAEEWQFDTESVNLVAMPLFHIAGSGWGVVGLFNGAHNVLLRDVDPVEILRLIPEHKITNALLVPAVLQFLLAVPDVDQVDFSSLRVIVYGASPITEEVLVGAMSLMKCGFAQAYGLTETTGGATILRARDHDPGGPRAHLLRSAGCPWGDVELRIIDAETLETLPDGEIGEILIRSVQNMKGYWKNDQATADAFLEGGWFRTGDAGLLDDGFLFIKDRVKDMIVSGAENIYPAEIENVLMAHPGIADAAVIGVPSEKWGETVKALVTRGDTDLSEQQIIDYCREHMAHYKCPTSVDWIDAIPRNPSGKILKTELRKPYWEGEERFVR